MALTLGLVALEDPAPPLPSTFVPTAALEVSCEACLLVGPDGEVLFERAAGEALPNASTTKIVTALVLRRSALPLGSTVEVSANAANAGGGGVDLQAGQSFVARDLLYAALMTSSNDAAVALAEAASGSEAAFVDEMNALAAELGATDSLFVTPHGLDRPGHVSSAADLALLGDALLDDPLLARIVATETYEIPRPDGPISLENRNLLLGSYPGAIGIKTGSTLGAGEALVAAAERRGVRLIAVVLRSTDAASDATALLNRGFKRLRPTTLIGAGERLGTLFFPAGSSTGVIAAEDVGGLADQSTLAVEFLVRRDLTAPLEAGEVVGRLVISAGNERIARVKALAADTVEVPGTSATGRFLAGFIRSVAGLIGRG